MPLISSTPFTELTYAQQVIADGATNYYRLGESSGPTAVDIAGSNDMTYEGTPIYLQTGLITGTDTAVDFNNAGGATGSSLGTLSFPYTIEAWVKVPTGYSPGGDVGIYSTHIAVEKYVGAGLYLGSDKTVRLLWGTGGAKVASSFKFWATTETLTEEATHHIVVIMTAFGAPTIYIDNTLATMNDIGGTATGVGYSDGVPTIGKFWNGFSADYAELTIDEVAFYHGTALNVGQVSNHYTLGTT